MWYERIKKSYPYLNFLKVYKLCFEFNHNKNPVFVVNVNRDKDVFAPENPMILLQAIPYYITLDVLHFYLLHIKLWLKIVIFLKIFREVLFQILEKKGVKLVNSWIFSLIFRLLGYLISARNKL